MLSLLFDALAPFKPLDFPPAPPAADLRQGEALYRNHEPIENTEMEDRQVLGTWFDGRVRRGVDQAVWLGPSLVARWLGYMAARDEWSKEELAKRWGQAREALNGEMVFVVRLCSFPKLDTFEFGADQSAKPNGAEGARFVLSFVPARRHAPAEAGSPFTVADDGTRALATTGTHLISLEKHEWRDIAEKPFYAFTAYEPLFLADGEGATPPDDGIPLGDFYGAEYVIEIKLPKLLPLSKSIGLRVRRGRKVQEVAFSLVRPLPKKDASASGH